MASIRRNFVAVGSRHVHYLRAGSGPVAILFHDSPRSSELNRPLISALADRFDVIAFDTPGFGLSDPLPGDKLTVPELADAWSETLAALGITQALIYGTHGSAKVALELSLRHPGRVAAVVLDGITIPIGKTGTPAPDLIAPFEISEDGSHLTSLWFRMREQSNFYPPSNRSAPSRLMTRQPDATALHRLMVDMLNAGPRYGIVYEAVIRYSPVDALGALAIPALVTARANDVSYSSLQRVPGVAPTTQVLPLPADEKTWLDTIRHFFLEHHGIAQPIGSAPKVKVDPGQVAHGYIGESGRQLRFRRRGSGPQWPLVLLHSPPGGGAQLSDLFMALSEHRDTIVVDLPGCGDSDASESALDAIAGSLLESLNVLCPHGFDLYAEGLAVPLATELAAISPARIGNVICDGGLRSVQDDETCSLTDWCPDLTPRFDGAHWIAAWYMLREQALRWPWFDGSVGAIRKVEPIIDAERLHRRTLDTLKRPENYAWALSAVLQFRWQERLPQVVSKLHILDRPGDPYYAWPEAANEQLKPRKRIKPDDPAEVVQLIIGLLE